MGGTFLCVWIARLVTQIGAGNGFLILMFYGTFKFILKNILYFVKDFRKIDHTSDQKVFYLFLFFILIYSIFFLWKFIQKAPRFPVKRNNGKLLWFEISPFPMSIQPGIWAIWMITMFTILLKYGSTLDDNFVMALQWMEEGWLEMFLSFLLMIPISLLFFNLFYSENKIFGLRVENLHLVIRKNEKLLDRQFWKAFIVLLIGTFLVCVPTNFHYVKSELEILIYGIGLFAIVQDIWSQLLFCCKYGQGLELLEIDNVNLASYLKGLFQVEKIPCLVQSYTYRRLFFILGPLYKMRLMVPANEIDRARSILSTVNYYVV